LGEAVDNESYHGFSRNTLILSIILNIALASSAGYLYFLSRSQGSLIDGLSDDVNELTESVNMHEQQMSMLNNQLEYYMDLANYYSNKSTSENGASAPIGHTTIPIVAVHTIQNRFNVEYEGVVMECEIELVEGAGRVLVDTVPMIGIDIQSSVRTATLVVEELAGLSFSNTDIVLTIRGTQEVDVVEGTQEVDVVDGGSAGAAITVALLAAVNNQELDESVYVTGTIKSDATIGEIGGAVYKALAVVELGATKFLVPKGQETIVVYQPKTVERFGRTRLIYDKVYMSLEEYLAEKGYVLDVIEVESIQEAYEIFSLS
jgi:predicted S18 family serine protease